MTLRVRACVYVSVSVRDATKHLTVRFCVYVRSCVCLHLFLVYDFMCVYVYVVGVFLFMRV